MKVLALLIVCEVSLASCALSTLSSTALPKQYQFGAVQTSQYVGPSIYPGHYIYNYLEVDQTRRGIPIAVFADGTHNIVQPTYNYFGTPIYDHRYFINPIFPGFGGFPGFQPPVSVPGIQPPMIPSQVPSFPPTTQRPFEDDGIEKLDEKLDPSFGGIGHPNDDDDTVTVDAF